MKAFPLKVVSAVVSLGILLSGCGTSGNSASTSGTAGKTAESGSNKVVDISLWYGISGDLDKDVQKMVKKFNDAHPAIHVTATYQGSYSGGGPEQQKLLAALAAGNPPDLAQIEVNSMGVFANSGKLMDLTDFMKNSSVDKPDNFLDGMLVSTQWNGKYYGVPLNRSVPVLYYNKTLFKKAGIQDPPKTWDELAADTKKLTSGSGDSKVYGYGPLVDWWPWESMAWSSGSEILSKDGKKATFNTPELNHVLTLQQNLVKSGDALVETGDNYWTLMTNDFINGKVAMDLDSIGSAAQVQQGVGSKFEWGTAYLPSDKTLNVPPGGGDMAIMNGIPQDHVKAAETFIEWWTSPKQTLEWSQLTGYLPVQKDAVQDQSYQNFLKKNPQFKTAIDELQYQKAAPASEHLLNVLQYMQQSLQGIFDQGKPVGDQLKKAVDQANSILGG
ncbi:ABC transporter substrate-binding protein [Pullulanibacillus sp. KACC 23026]|uniref:ABC transporter substrate-binding protein n=1 Tax=Pullulanibacillus sp. KACC 23026 TaxID=3028315 RepID=UPI0023B005DC|nr:ABC transporter substrate-binding protein [Pullulanibacillus sp. KACC 23026]WEG13510.1 ABC transporter substrate-binding protein [Pullulanibacillus sp. KACC 23026]